MIRQQPYPSKFEQCAFLGAGFAVCAMCIACGGGTQKVDGPHATLATKYVKDVKIKELGDGEVVYANTDAIHVSPAFKVWINHSRNVFRSPAEVIAKNEQETPRIHTSRGYLNKDVDKSYICICKKNDLLYVIVSNKQVFSRDGAGSSYHKDTFTPVAGIIVKSGQEEYTANDFDTFFRNEQPKNEALVLKVED